MNKITFSRHAKRRLHLYEINEEDIVNLMGNVLNKSNGQYEKELENENTIRQRS